MEKTTRKRGRPRIEVTQDVLEARRLARQRYNARRTEGKSKACPCPDLFHT
ncbi:hypothetical protein DCAR_0312206 [Daucus carota subsp. sativus]|uniref:Uncharacterized protein n=1 Tax=Daucus carota subsp. sativus TaxID=79200 RepID=A0A175Y958_DAUCS|nr:hypothetical protein DCAR_0312206 [Daucus carota subsp. sativus]